MSHKKSSQKKSSQKLGQIFGKPDTMHIHAVLAEKLAQFNTRYEEITRVILSHTERSFVDVRLSLMEDHCEEILEAKEKEMKRYISDVMKHSEVLVGE